MRFGLNIPTTQQIFEFYDKNSNLSLEEITVYLLNENPTTEEIAAFNDKVTAANIKILQDIVKKVDIRDIK